MSEAVVSGTAPVLLSERRGNVLVLTLNRPQVRNAVNTELGTGLLAAVAELDASPELRVGVITGAGGGFCAGMDLKAFLTEGDPKGLDEFVHRAAGKPLIAAVEGFAMAGGLEIALTCDFVVAATGARLAIPEVKVGLFAGGGGVFRLGRRLPYGLAMRMALTGEPITAEEAFAAGLVAEVTPVGGALDAALVLATAIARNSPLGVQHSRDLLQASTGQTEAEYWAAQAPLLREVLDSDDAREGAAAFVGKRPPVWTGR